MSKPVCVFCGSSPGVKPLYTKSAQAVGRALAAEGTKLVYGGGRRGIMGVVSQSALEAGGHVHGIVPSALTVRAAGSGSAEKKAAESAAASSAEGAGKDLLDDMQKYEGRLQLEIVGSMHERKAKMAQVSTGGFIVLPGGYGTFEEAFEMITWNQLRIHQLPVVILNVDNFYTPLRDLVESAAKSGFINPENLSLVKIVDLDGEGGNSDESRAEEWGAAAIKALKEFKFSAGAGYNLQWDTETSTPEP